MTQDTKDIIYLLLDILDSFSRNTSTERSPFTINKDALSKVKNELFDLVSQKSIKENNENNENVIKSLIGVLPFVLIDKNKFPTNNDIIKFGQNTLNLNIPSWEKKSREEIIGRFIAQIATKSKSDLSVFFFAWEEFNSEKKNIKLKKTDRKVDFVDAWLNFFENYSK